jgi:hypothetical protein
MNEKELKNLRAFMIGKTIIGIDYNSEFDETIIKLDDLTVISIRGGRESMVHYEINGRDAYDIKLV